jgi:hypothetical protein
MAVIAEVLALTEEGLSRVEISRRTGVPVDTIQNWRRGRLPLMFERLRSGDLCHECLGAHDVDALPTWEYAYVLGLYLGDGCLGRHGRTWSLRVVMDGSYPGIVGECREALAIVSPSGKARVYSPRRDRSVVIYSYAREWPCLFPQHGPGKKHHRGIELVEWQRRIVDRAPEALIRGLIQSDGWRGTNRVVSKGKAYEYPRYQFSSRSEDIRRIFTDACDALEIAWRPWGRWHISVARRDAVARLDQFVGLKS